MATVTGLTAARMLAIEAASVVDGEVVGDDLILEKHDGTTFNAGSVRGPQGIQGPAGSPLGAWPIGSIFISTVNTNPNTLLGGGTWVAYATGRFLVGIDGSQARFDTVEETGGAVDHTHTLANAYAMITMTSTSPWAYIRRKVVSSYNAVVAATDAGTTVASNTSAQTTAAEMGGSTDATENLPPYIVCYMWKRTA